MGKSHPLLIIGDGMRSASSALRIVLSTTLAMLYLHLSTVSNAMPDIYIYIYIAIYIYIRISW